MDVLRIQIKNGIFAGHNEVGVKTFSSNYVEGNGWKCILEDNGGFYCTAVENYSGVKHRIKFKIQDDGWVKMALKIGDDQFQPLKEYELDHWPVDGVIALPASFMDGHKPYFREDSFQKFLDEHSLTTVRSEFANGIYLLETETYNGEIVFSETIETDGKTIEILDVFDYPGKCTKQYFWRYREMEVSGATWVVKTTTKDNIIQKTLFTKSNPMKLEGLPKFE